ncbi:unnamed protein product [Staurois parvus]|uniref:Uncharacterized protein n=1 Tax=Staurois parvus TaxID=386267 RepID=A0ABN9AWQ6_9NEOB|nr:unnamed protein product [Staurois parvus]
MAPAILDCVRSLGVRGTVLYGTSVGGPNHVITDWPISDHYM